LLGGHFPALVVLSVVLDGLRERSFLLVLDAETFAETGRAAPHVIPFGFHGEFKG
jgi:torulene dioxygenase